MLNIAALMSLLAATPGRARVPDHLGENVLCQPEIVWVGVRENHVAHRDREDALARGRVPARRALKHLATDRGLVAGQGDQQVFLGIEVLIKRVGGVIASLGHPRHLQAEQAVLQNQCARVVDKALLSLGHVAKTAFSRTY